MMCRTERRGRSACERYQAKHLAMLPLACLDHLPMLLQWDTYLLCFELAYNLRTSQAIKITNNYLISRPKPPESRIVEADKYCPTGVLPARLSCSPPPHSSCARYLLFAKSLLYRQCFRNLTSSATHLPLLDDPSSTAPLIRNWSSSGT